LPVLPDLLGPNFWAAESRHLLAVLLPLIQEGAELGVEIAEGDLWDEFQIGFDNALANEAAASWARMHTDDLLEMLGTTTQRVVGAQIANYIETPGMTQGDLAAALEKVLGTNRQRALLIGRTESTRATAAGRNESRIAAGLPLTLFPPPLHPRGRCFDAVELLDDGTWVVTWQTRRDEIVCIAEYDVPWGTVRGCRGMQGRVISEGPYFGMLIEQARAIAADRAEEQITAEQASAELAGALTGYEAWQAGRRSAPVKFDPAQPRDESGRWTTTGAGDYGQGTAPSEAGIVGAEKAEVMFNEGLAKDWRGASAQQAADIKDDIVKKISDDSDMSYDDTNNFIHQWAESSNDDDLRSLAIQRDTAAEFRVELSGFTNDRISEMNVEREEFEVKMRKRARRQFRSELESGAMTESQFQAIASEWIADTLSDVHPRLLPLTEPKAQRQILRAMYDNTQARLRDAGLKAGDTIRLYRGTRLPDKVAADWKLGDVVSVVGNALESWSLSKEVADKFARGSFAQPDVRGIIFEMDIPVEAIIGSARTGFGCLTEGEFVVLGIPGDAQVELNF